VPRVNARTVVWRRYGRTAFGTEQIRSGRAQPHPFPLFLLRMPWHPSRARGPSGPADRFQTRPFAGSSKGLSMTWIPLCSRDWHQRWSRRSCGKRRSPASWNEEFQWGKEIRVRILGFLLPLSASLQRSVGDRPYSATHRVLGLNLGSRHSVPNRPCLRLSCVPSELRSPDGTLWSRATPHLLFPSRCSRSQ
jgi:hypothetical protein